MLKTFGIGYFGPITVASPVNVYRHVMRRDIESYKSTRLKLGCLPIRVMGLEDGFDCNVASGTTAHTMRPFFIAIGAPPDTINAV